MLECLFLSIPLLVRLKLSGVPFKFLGKLLALPVNIRKGSKDLTWTNTLAYFDSLSVTNKKLISPFSKRVAGKPLQQGIVFVGNARSLL